MGYHHLFCHARARLVINQAVLPLRTVNNGCLLTLSYVVPIIDIISTLQNYKSNHTCCAYSIINHEMSYDRITHRKFCRAKFEGNIN